MLSKVNYRSVKNIFKIIFVGKTRPRQMFNLYFFTLLVWTILLMTPIATTKGQWNFLPALFTASSAFSDTGLTVKSTANDFTFFGQFIILILIKFGGIGLITVKLAILSLFVFNRHTSLRERLLMQGERGSNKLGKTIDVLKIGIIVMTITECLGAIVLFLYFYFVPISGIEYGLNNNTGYYNHILLALWSGIFHSISAVNNAGFDIVGITSLEPFQSDYFVQWIFIIEFVIGGIGFPVYYDLYHWIKSKTHGKKFRFSLFTKLTLITYFLVAILGVSSVMFIEYFSRNVITPSRQEPIFKNLSTSDAIMAVFFNTMSTRNAGYYTVDLNKFHLASQMIQSLMMWIGSSPASTAGGIRTTTLAIILLTIFNIARGRNDVFVFKRKIPNKTVRMSFIVGTLGFILVFVSVMIITIENVFLTDNSDMTFAQVIFDVSSAFGTTGLSLFDNSKLGIFSQLSLIFVMFVGQLGVSTTVLAWSDRKSKPTISRVEENVLIG
ncbi:TrkH family potassium uptake protein [Spiroplasma endosymbiont of Apeira syringaria]|uniref:TrkH family potassium uptake protein n=1 Tax=Spiroplasma endosymbiont of Apeira syringaria TaxID=3066307 RepID=UPI0030D05A86